MHTLVPPGGAPVYKHYCKSDHQNLHYSLKKPPKKLCLNLTRSHCLVCQEISCILCCMIQNVLLFYEYLCRANKWDLPASLFCFIFPWATWSFSTVWLSHDLPLHNDSYAPLTPLPFSPAPPVVVLFLTISYDSHTSFLSLTNVSYI